MAIYAEMNPSLAAAARARAARRAYDVDLVPCSDGVLRTEEDKAAWETDRRKMLGKEA